MISTARGRFSISATRGAPPYSPSRVQGSSPAQVTRSRVVWNAATAPPRLGLGLHQSHHDALKLGGVLGLADQNDLKLSVVQLHPLGVGPLEASHRHGVAHHPEEEIPLLGAPIVLHPQAVGLKGGQPGRPLQQIRQVAEDILKWLGRIVGHVGKGAEGGHIDKVRPVEAPHIHRPWHPPPATSIRPASWGRWRFREKSLVVPAGI